LRKTALSLLASTALACFASTALAAEITRDSYKEAVEPICKTNAKANERLLGNVRNEVKTDKLKPAAAKFSKAAAALKRTVRQLKAVPPPSADQARITKWLGFVTGEARLFETVAAKLRAGDKAAASAKVIKLTHNATQANNVVIPFEFHYCKFEPNKYT
jgi:hypothetical protein